MRHGGPGPSPRRRRRAAADLEAAIAHAEVVRSGRLRALRQLAEAGADTRVALGLLRAAEGHLAKLRRKRERAAAPGGGEAPGRGSPRVDDLPGTLGTAGRAPSREEGA